MRTELVHIRDYFDRLSEAGKSLDTLNVAIFTWMSKAGPRNLLEVSRRTGIPFTTVYHRVRKFESDFGRISHLAPTYSKLALTCLVVINNATSGNEERLSLALKIPNYWSSVTRCEGGFTHYSIHSVPLQHVRKFRQYLAQLIQRGLAESLKIIQVGDYEPFNLNFRNYDPRIRTWRFPWDHWLDDIREQKIAMRIDDPEGYPHIVDKRDLLIVKELEKNGRKTFAELAPMVGITLQGTKLRFDKLTKRGICRNYWIDVFPYPREISAMYDIMLDFRSAEAMNRFYSFIGSLFFIISAMKVLNRNSLILRTYILESQVSNLFQFLAELATRKMVTSYSALRLRLETRESQTISYELFDDQKGWIFDYEKCVKALRNL
jgi:DNA-binding Lrp family transcriptional regulator